MKQFCQERQRLGDKHISDSTLDSTSKQVFPTKLHVWILTVIQSNFCTRTIITVVNIDLLSQMCFHVYTYKVGSAQFHTIFNGINGSLSFKLLFR